MIFHKTKVLREGDFFNRSGDPLLEKKRGGGEGRYLYINSLNSNFLITTFFNLIGFCWRQEPSFFE